ncbi:MAG: polysaccharide biosynthesis tyrosine autokinase [Chthoniobacteraceae bacterium]
MDISKMDEPGAAAWWISFLTRLPRYKFLLRRRWWILVLTLALGLFAAAWRVTSQPILFVSTARLIVSGKFSIQENASYNEEAIGFFVNEIERFKSGEVRRRAEERLQALYPGIRPSPVMLDASQFPHSSIFVLSAVGGDGDYAQKLLNACMDEYMDARKEVRSEKSETMLDTLNEQLARYEKEEKESEEELLDFQKQNNVASLQEASSSAGTYIVKLNEQIADLKNEYQLLDLLNLDQTIERKQPGKNADDSSGVAPAGSDSVLKTDNAETAYLQAKQEIEIMKARRADLSKVLRPRHPDMVQLNLDIARQETLLTTFKTQTLDQLKTRKESIGLQIKNLEKTVKDWESKAMELNQKMADYNRIKSKGDRAKASYESISNSFNSVHVSKSVDQDMVSIFDRASPPVSVRPGLAKMITLGLFGGAIVGVAILFLLDKIDDRMNSFGEFQSHFNEDVLAKIPTDSKAAEPLPIEVSADRVPFVESMRALRSSIFYMPVEGVPPKTFLITSAVPNEGKTTIATNLAITMSFTGAKVLLVDGDLRRGAIHELFGLPNGVGLGNIFKEDVPVETAIRATKIENLSFISRGANLEHPGESFLGKKMDQLLKDLYPKFEYIIFDSPPILVADDTTSLAPKIDATIMVVRFSFSSARRSREAIELLKKRQVNLIGIVCNGVDQLMRDYYYNKYPEYYAVKRDA